MKKITAFTTMNGIIHPNHDAAKRHAEKRYGDALAGVARTLVRMDKLVDACTFIDGHLALFQNLAALKQDCEVEPTDNED